MTRRPLRAACLGDIFSDFIADLDGNSQAHVFDRLASSTNVFAPVRQRVGGAGVQFAVAARRSGFERVTLIGKIGADDRGNPDPAALAALDYLEQQHVDCLLSRTTEAGTGLILIIYLSGDRRLMISDPRANNLFESGDVTLTMRSALTNVDLFHVSGYSLVHPARCKATLGLMRLAHAHGAQVALDVVPHDIYQYPDAIDAVLQAKSTLDWLLIELPAAHRIVHGERLVDCSELVVETVLTGLEDLAKNVCLHIRPSLAVVSQFGKRWRLESKYTPGEESRGQSAVVQANLLFQVLSERDPSNRHHEV